MVQMLAEPVLERDYIFMSQNRTKMVKTVYAENIDVKS